MAQQNDFETLISEKDVPIVKLVAKTAKPHSQRARALLELNKGRSVEDAAELSGLRVTQVRYWQRVYRTAGLDIFPDSLLVDETGLEDISDALKSEDSEASVSRPPSAAFVAQKAKSAKSARKGRKNKKNKPDNKDKKGKKMKKDKKENKKAEKKKDKKKDKKKADKGVKKAEKKAKKAEKKGKKKDKKGKKQQAKKKFSRDN